MKAKDDEMNDPRETPLCACCCGQSVKKRRNGAWNQFCVGHNPKHGKSGQTSKSWSSGEKVPGCVVIRADELPAEVFAKSFDSRSGVGFLLVPQKLSLAEWAEKYG